MQFSRGVGKRTRADVNFVMNYHQILNDIHTRMHVMFLVNISQFNETAFIKGRSCGANTPLVVLYTTKWDICTFL